MISDLAVDSSLGDEESCLEMAWFLSQKSQMVAISLLVVAVSSLLLGQREEKGSATANPHTTSNEIEGTIPFMITQEPSWRDLSVTLEKYRTDSSNLLRGVSQSLEVALHSEREMGISHSSKEESSRFLFSKRLETHLDRVSAALEHNENELVKLMQQFPVRFALPQTEDLNDEEEDCPNQNDNNTEDESTSKLFILNNRFSGMAEPTKKNAYDCGAQIIAHIVRDWTILGTRVRSTIYDWCRAMAEKHVSRNALPILVPGSGLGRLAHDLAFCSGYPVEANEISLSMAAGAHTILQGKEKGTIYPFALDSFANEVEADRRYDLVDYPALPKRLQKTNINGTLSYQLGDFVNTYRWQRPRGSFQCVVTCFFIDTATNIYEYLSTIEHALAPGGYWINIGPLRWHHNSVLHPAANELRAMIESSIFAFDLVHWSVDEEASNYRQDDDENFVRATSYDGYKPIRFVVKRR